MFILDLSVNPGSTNPFGLTADYGTGYTSGPPGPSLIGGPPGPGGFGSGHDSLNPEAAARLGAHQSGHSAAPIVSGVGGSLLLMCFISALRAGTGAAFALGPIGIAAGILLAIFMIYSMQSSKPPTDTEIVRRGLQERINAGQINPEQLASIEAEFNNPDATDATKRAKLQSAGGLSGAEITTIFNSLQSSRNRTADQDEARSGKITAMVIGAIIAAFVASSLFALPIGLLIGFCLVNTLTSASAPGQVGSFMAGLGGRHPGIDAYPTSLNTVA